MKKLILSTLALFTFGFANAQEAGFKAGVHVGLPMGDIKEGFSLNAGLDVAYMFEVADKFLVGPTTGYSHYLGKTFNDGFFGSYKVEDVSLVPIAASAQFSISDNFFFGTDLGYGLLFSEGENEGGVYYQPKVGYQTEKIELTLGYKGVSIEGGSFTSVGLGFNYKF